MWSPAKFVINNNAKVPVLMNLFNMSIFKIKVCILLPVVVLLLLTM